MKIKNIRAREVLDSRGFPTVEVDLTLDSPQAIVGRAICPSGASTGEGEALELRDGDKKRYLGKGVLHAVENVREKIAPALIGRDFPLQSLLDDALRDLDGTPNKSKLGANALLPVSMAFCRAQAQAHGVTTSAHIAGIMSASGHLLPTPMMNIINGGKHADNSLAVQEFMIVPAGFKKFSEALRAGAEVFHRLKKILHDKGLATGVGDEGGFAPVFQGEHVHEQAIAAILQAISDAGYKAGTDIFLALDAAASEFASKSEHKDDPVLYDFEGTKRPSEEMVAIYSKWAQTYPILSIEDGLSEHDWTGWAKMTEKLGKHVQIVGDDIFVTNPIFLKQGIDKHVGNAILIKLNQIGTVTETLETIKMASQAKYQSVTSHRSGETEDTFIAELAVGTDCGQIKTGSLSRTDRIAKYNQLLRIEEHLGDKAKFNGLHGFRK